MQSPFFLKNYSLDFSTKYFIFKNIVHILGKRKEAAWDAHRRKTNNKKIRLTHKLFISCCHTSISLLSFSNLHSVIVVVSQCGKVSCYSAFWNAVDRTRSPVLCIFHIFFRVYPKNSNLSSFHQQPPPCCCCSCFYSKETVGGFFLNWLYSRVWDDGDGIEYKMNWD